MKLYLPVFAVVATVMSVASSDAATNYYGYGANNNNNYQRYETRTTTQTYSNSGARGGANYYTTAQPYGRTYTTAQPSSGRGQMYRTYNSGQTATRTTRTTRSTETVRTKMKRKYYLAHPFFQPTEGMFGSVTDLSYNLSSYDINFIPSGAMSDTSATWKMNQFAIKEDLSYGITDRIGILAMGRYDFSKYRFDWSAAPDDKIEEDGLNLYGLGLQFRFADNDEWIATMSAYYQRQQDIANEFALDLRVGYKVSKSTIYGIARGWLVNFDDEYYGNGTIGANESGVVESLFIAYDEDVKNTFFGELGLGVFSVLHEDWTLNLEAMFGHYDWHNQASVKGAIGWQPNDWFALNLYAKTSFFDTADGKTLNFYGTELGEWHAMGQAKLDKYREMSFGGQVIFYF
jgi:hypothetical protein